MRVVPYAVGRDAESRRPIEIVLKDELPTDESLSIAYEVGERFEGDHFGNNLILSYHDKECSFSVHDIIIPNLSEDVLSAICSKHGIKIVDDTRKVELVCSLSTADVA